MQTAMLHDETLTAESIYDEYARYITNVTFGMLGADSEVDDVVQEVFSVVIRKLPGLRESRAVRAWLTSITVKCVYKMVRRRRVRRVVESAGLQPAADLGPGGGEAGDLLVAVNDALDRLSPLERSAWVLRYTEGESLADVARRLRCSLTTAKRRIAAADVIMRAVVRDG